MTGLANMLAFEFGLRVSEYCYNKNPEANHAIMATDVLFEVVIADGITTKLTPWQLTAHLNLDQSKQLGQKQTSYPKDNSLASQGLHPSSVSLIHLLLRSQKNHPDGNTRRMVLRRDYQHQDSPINTLIECLVTFAKFSKIGPEDPFFSRWKGSRKVLHRKMVSKMLKDIAKELGYSEKNFSSHCNRIGCASGLHAAGYTPEDISMYIGWTSTAVFGYLQKESPSLLTIAGQEEE